MSDSRHLVVAPIQAQRVSDVVAERLAQGIRDGALKPGDRLPTEQELARDFGVGRTSVREGLQKLRAHGLIESRKGLGAFVALPPPLDPLTDFARWTAENPRAIVELVEGRFALEAVTASLAALRASPEEVAVLERHEAEHAAAAARADVDAIIATDVAFHEGIFVAGRNEFLQRLYALLVPELNVFRRKTLALPWAGERSVRGHKRIVDAIRRHDPAAAREAMIDHLWVLYAEIQDSALQGGEAGELAPLPREAL